MGRFFSQKWVWVVIAIIILMLLVWFLGPYVSLGHQSFESTGSRFGGMLFMGFGVGAIAFTQMIIKARINGKIRAGVMGAVDSVDGKKSSGSGGGGGAGGAGRDSAESEQLRKRFEEAVKTLKSSKGKHGDLYSIPWYMIIGPPGSGKTTALVHSGLNFPLEQKFGKGALRGVGGTRNCDWWFTEDAVLLDTAGRYTTQDSDEGADSKGWTDFLALLKRFRGRRPVNGVLVAISASDLLGDPRVVGGHVAAIRHRLAELNQHLRIKLPVYLLVTKIDLLAGFMEFFEDLSQDERRQVWGITFPVQDSENGRAPGRLQQDLAQLLLRIQQRRLERLAAETDPRRRSTILAFPAQFSALAEALTAFVNEAFGPSAFDEPALLRGVYMTSGTQESTPIDRAMGAVSRAFGVGAEEVARPNSSSGRAYFLERLLKDVIFKEEGLAGVNRKAEVQKLALQIAGYVACGLLAVGAILAFWVSYGRNATYLAEVGTALQKYKDAPSPPAGVSGARVGDALPRLAAVRDLAEVANQHAGHVPLSMRFWLYRGAAVGAAADDAYLRELDGSLLPVLGDGFRAGLSGAVAEPDKLFEYLKAYLMLGDPKRLDGEQLSVLAALEWRRLLPNAPSSRSDLQEHTHRMFAEGARLRPLLLDQPLVESAQASLANASLPVLMYSRLRLAYAIDKEHAVRFDRVAGSAQVFVRRSQAPLSDTLSALYTRTAFDEYQATGRLKLAKQFQDDAWVLGRSAPPLTAMRDVSDKVVEIYEDDYIKAWDAVLADFTFRSPKDSKDLEQLLRLLGNPASPFKEFVNIVNANTNFAVPPPGGAAKPAAKPAGLSALESKAAQLDQMLGGNAAPDVVPGTKITKHFEAYDQMVAGSPPPIDRILQAFLKAADSVQSVSSGGGGTAAQAEKAGALKDLKSEAALMPPSMAKLISDIAGGTEITISGQVRNELALQYQTEVVRPCKEAVSARFPFEAGATQEVPLDDFARVFGPGGVYDTFFQQHLRDLVDTARNPWAWREGAGTAAAIPGLLAQFQAAQRVRDVFFAAGGNKPGVKFTLTPVELDAEATRFSLDVDGHPLEYRHGPVRSVSMQWPGNETGDATVQFEPASAAAPAYTGAWSLFRLLARAQVQPQSDVKFLLTFSAGSLNAKVQLDAASVRNPFAHPEVLKFRCGG